MSMEKGSPFCAEISSCPLSIFSGELKQDSAALCAREYVVP